MSKNIVICCDGTGNHIVSYPSNVIHTFSACVKEKGLQECYYNTGLGTTPLNPDGTSEFGKIISIGKGLLLGGGLKRDVRTAYHFLVNHYEEGDKIFMFGFSRGAYTLRVLVGFIQLYGLMYQSNVHLFNYSFDLYGKKYKGDSGIIFRNARRFSSRFSRNINIQFMGLWDTVSSIGWAFNFRSFPYTKKLPNVKVVRHAIALNEARVFYQPVLITKDIYVIDQITGKREKQDLDEQWFVGVHSDVGGSYHDNESGLAMLPLHWILSEASALGLLVDKAAFSEIILPKKKPKTYKTKNILHNSAEGIFWFLELLPKRRLGIHPLSSIKFKFKEKRTIPADATKHRSVDYILKSKFENGEYLTDLSEFYEKIKFQP